MNVRHEYSPPSFEELIERAKTLPKRYQKENNPTRTKLIKVLTFYHGCMYQISLARTNNHKQHLQDICIGSRIFGLEMINNEYALLDPSYKKGFFFNSGSNLFKIMLNDLNIKSLKEISDTQRLGYLEKFYNFSFNNQSWSSYADIEFPQSFSQNSLDLNDIKELQKQLEEVMAKIIKRCSAQISTMEKAIPTQTSLNSFTQTLPLDYKNIKIKNKHKINKEREFHAQFVAALTAIVESSSNRLEDERIISCNNVKEDIFLSRSQRIIMGNCLYIMDAVDKEYYLRSARHSVLFQRTAYAMNIKELKDLHPYIQLQCLLAFKIFLKENNTAAALEEYGRIYYPDNNHLAEIDTKILKIKQNLKFIIHTLSDKCAEVRWPATKALSAIGASVGLFSFW